MAGKGLALISALYRTSIRDWTRVPWGMIRPLLSSRPRRWLLAATADLVLMIVAASLSGTAVPSQTGPSLKTVSLTSGATAGRYIYSPSALPATGSPSATADRDNTFSFATGVSSDRRYLIDQHGKPYLLVGDAPQAMIGDLSLGQANSYFADRQAHAINAVWINLLCDKYTSCSSDGQTYNGIPPFTRAGDISTPNPTYFRKVDAVLRLAAKHGITVFLDPAETGGWLKFLESNGVRKDAGYGEYLAYRYKAYQNIVWLLGNDFQSWSDTGADAVVTAMADGLRAGGDHHVMSIELDYNQSLSTDDPNWGKRVNISAGYSYYPTYDEVLKGYDDRPVLPVFFVEGHYDAECVGPGGCGTPIVLRRQEYWTMTSGATGQLYGSQYWGFKQGWQNGIDSVGASQLAIMAKFFKSLPWYNLAPSQDHSLVTSGYGSYSTSGSTLENDYVTAAETDNGMTAVIYLPTAHTIAVNLTKLSGRVTARWFDPTTGSYTKLGSFRNVGSRQFKSPPPHGDGADDWVLLLQGHR